MSLEKLLEIWGYTGITLSIIYGGAVVYLLWKNNTRSRQTELPLSYKANIKNLLIKYLPGTSDKHGQEKSKS